MSPRGLFLTLRQLGRALAMSVEGLWAYKLRGAFIVLGVGLGISALTLIVTAVEAANRMATDITAVFGPDAAFVIGGSQIQRAVGGRQSTLTQSDVENIRRSLPGVKLVVPMRSVPDLTLRRGGRNYRTPIAIGSTAQYAEAWNWPLVEGRDITEEDVEQSAKVCLIGDIPARELFGDESPIGKTIFVKDMAVQIIGRLLYRGAMGGGGGQPVDDRIILPITTLTQRFNLDRRFYRALRVRFHQPELMDQHKENLRSYLRHLHRLAPDAPDDFTLITADEVLKFLSMLRGSLVAFLGVTAGAAMLVGGFVLANLFYLSVTERTQEIGLRKALGAKGWTIAAQFLGEAVALTFIGALVGLAGGLGAGRILSALGTLDIRFSPQVFFYALAAALAIGVIFGFKPAQRAANLEPIAALRGDNA